LCVEGILILYYGTNDHDPLSPQAIRR